MNPTRRMYSIVSTLVILAMLLQAVPVRADDFAPPTPTPTAPPTPTPTSTATATETPTETASPTPEATPTATGTPIGAPAGTPYPAPGEPVTSAPTVTPSETPSPSPTATSVPTQTLPSETTVPTPTPPADQEPPAAELALLLSASDGLATPGGSLGLGWKIDDWQDSLKDLALKISTTQNLAPNAGVYDPRDDAYLLPVNAAEEWIQWEIPVDQEGPYTFTAELTLEGKVVATHTLSVPEAGLTRLSVAGGLAEGLNGKVRVLFPPEAAGEELDVRVRPLLGELRSIAMGSSHAFEIVARSAASKAEVTQFKTPLTIEVAYQGREDANLFYYDEANGKWEALPSEYDREAGVVRGYSDHLTIFNIDVNSWQSSQLPGMNGFQVSQFSGSATYDYPIWTPPGPGGLQPVLSLSYNSLSVDSAYAQRTQASWVGMGWSLQTGSITRDMHGTITADGDDTMNLSLNGVSSRLLMDSSGVYHMADENFWKVSYSGDVWTLYDKVGNRYVFGGYNGVASTAARGFFPDFPGAQAPCTQAYGDLVHRWMLTEIIDKFGNKLEYLYHPKESKQVDRTCSGDEAHTVDMAIYLKEIRYSGNDGRYRIFFDIAQNRFDYPTNWNDPHQYTFWERSRLQAIRVVHDPDGSGAGAGVAVRTYQFTYDDFIYPGWEWGSGGRSFVLTKIEEIGLNSQHLPDVTFTYDDLHLTNASNGYGGEVEFTYESSPWIETGVNTEEFGYYYEETCPAGWTGVSCETGNKIRVSSEGKHDFGMNAVRPGSGYLVSLPFLNLGSTGSATVLLQYSDNPGDRVTVGTATSQNPGVNAAVVLPTSAGATTHLFIIVQCTNCLFDGDDVKIWAAPTYYRVIERELSDSGESVTTGYNYDGPATNDAAHSDLVRDHLSTLYGEAYDEYRGHAMVREQSPDGYVTTSFFHQDDDLTGRSSVSLVGTQSYYQPFSDTSWSSYSSAWTYWTTQPTFERQDGDLAAKVVYSGGGWQGMLHRNTYSLTSGKNAVVQFRVAEDAGGNQEAVFALESGTIGSNYQSWRVYLKQDGTLWSSYCTTSGGSTTCSFQNQLYSANEFKLNTWYVLMLIADDTNGFYLRVWPREDPGAVKSDRRSFSIASWRFAGYVNYGTMWLDEYSEGVLYSLSSSEAETEESIFATSTMFDDYPDLTIDWTRALTETQLSFEGTSRWLGIRTLFAYNPSEQTGTQYGNLTRTYNEEWIENPPYYTGWYRDRVTVTGYYPPSGGNPYLVGLPSYTNTYRCNGAPCASPGSADLLSSHWYLYDDHSSYNQAPSFGELTGERDLLRFAGANYTDPRYRDLRYDHDSYGNLTSTSAWSGEGTLSSPASAGKRTSTITYDATYHTYALAQTDPLGFVTTLTYDYNFGSPLSETDINGNTTSAGYDNFGRITSVRRPGDESGAATMTFTYADFPGTGVPYYTEATQKIDSSTTYRVRKYYDGLGRLLQTHVIGASINGATKDVLVDSFYDSAGRQWKQTVPYEATSGAYWHNRSGSQPYAETLYDEMGRVYQSKATDGSVQAEYSYTSGYYPSGSNGMDGRGYAETCVLDAMLRETCTKTDLRGRANEVHAPAEPWLRYTYDEAGRLTGAEQMAGSTPQTSTQLFYDLAGRKTQMNDPDMGTWYYQYDATGALTRQTDARGQTLLMNYDPLYRLTSKGKLTFEDLFNTKDTGSWTYNAYQVVPYNDNGSNVVKNTGTGVDWAAGFRRNGYSLASGKALQLRFKVSDSNSSVHLMIENNDATYRRFAAYNVNGKLYSQYNVGGGYYMGNTLLESFLANVWYVLRITVDDVNGFKVEAYREDNPNEYGSYTNAMVSGKTWRFNTTTKYGIEYVDDYQEMDVLARYSYDDYNPGSAQWGKGLRTGMIDSSGSTYWRYDQRGRMRWEDKWIGSIDHFVTEWSYNSADLLAWMKYPGGDGGQQGEQVTYRYYPQMTIQDTMGSDGGNNYYYLQQAQYDAAGRADLLRLGAASLLANSVLLRDYRYHDWTRPNGQGRLMWIKSGIFNNPTSLQDLRFYTGSDASPSPSYDAVGNILGIYDYKAGSPQTQSFGYDDLDRLTSAQATGGTIGLHGVYNQETYAYDSLGRLTGLPSLGTYSYNPSVSCAAGNRTLPHAVASVSNNSYAYDCNGNMTTRTLGGNNTFNFTYDAENRLSGVSGAATNSYYYDGDSKRVKEVTYENLAAGIPFTSSAAIYFPEAGTDGDTYPNSGAGDSGEFAAVWSGNHYAQLDLGSTYSVDKIRVWHFFADGRTYHGVKLQVSANGTSWTTIYDSAVQGEYAETSAGKTHTFSAQSVRYVREYLNGSTANAGDHWVEMEVFGSRTNVMIGDYFEWNENSGTMVKYYYAGSERIAMREGTGTLTTGLKWLLGDHLGSTSISAQGSDGAKLSELRFKPFGELRFAWGTTTTSLRYTGQRAEGTGLYDYKARFYDPMLGRFIQPDTIIPDPGNPLDWDRYAYVRNNALRYTDPSGHDVCDEDGNCFEGRRYRKINGQRRDVPLTENGAVVAALYRKMRNIVNDKWNPDGDLTIEEFLGLWILHEANGIPEHAAAIASAVAQSLYVGGYNPAYCSGACRNGLFNYMGAQSQLAGGLFTGTTNLNSYSGPPKFASQPWTMEDVAKYGNDALHPKSLDWDRNDAPSNWGGAAKWGDALSKAGIEPLTVNGTGKDTIYFYNGVFVVFSVNQRYNWCLKGVDTSMDTNPPTVNFTCDY